MNKLKLFILALLLLPIAVLAQQKTRTLTPEPKTFMKDLQDLFSQNDVSAPKGKEIITMLNPIWYNDNIFTPERRQKVYEICNQYLMRKGRAYPNIYNYLLALEAVNTIEISEYSYDSWQEGLIRMLNNKKSKLSDMDKYNASIVRMLKENAIFSSYGMRWYGSNSSFQIMSLGDTTCYYYENLDLHCKVRNDSLTIYNTSGYFNPISNMWYGNSGMVFWERVGLSRDSTWAEVDQYTINLAHQSYTMKNVYYYNLPYFSDAIIGTITDKVVENSYKGNYPKFQSDDQQLKIKNLYTDIDFQGGFIASGSKVSGAGTAENPAKLTFYREYLYANENGETVTGKRKVMYIEGQHFSFKSDRARSLNAKTSIYIEDDSIFHPGLEFKYNNDTRTIELLRDNSPENMSRSPYVDSYHKMELDFSLLTWQMDDDKIYMGNTIGSTINYANFESQNYFTAQRYYEAQGLEETHPYLMLRSFVQRFGSKEFYVEDFAKYIKMGMTTTKRLLIQLAYKKIVELNTETDWVIVLPKLYRYLDCVVGKRDYDLIKLESETGSGINNAELNLLNMDLAIRGVPMVNVSDSQNVIFYPSKGQILVKRDMNFDFGGRIEAGLFTFYGTDFHFNYEDFMVELSHVDSLKVKVKTGVNAKGERMLANVQNSIENITGKLKIDDPTNKSGVKRYLQYPIFASEKDSYVYYDAPHIADGKYTRDSFYFQVYPYTIDSLNHFSTEALGYDGELHSSDIFPVFKQRLSVQDDFSFGFVERAPQGYPAYKGKGTYYNDIYMSNKGLRGNGEIKYQLADIKSDDFLFFPDSANAITTSMTIDNKPGIHTNVAATQAYIHWEPYNEVLDIKSLGAPLALFNGECELKGHVFYGTNSISAKGTATQFDGAITSNLFKMRHTDYSCDTASLQIKSYRPENLAISTSNLKTNVDFATGKATFKSNSGTERVEFPENLYLAWVENFSWMMRKKQMQFASSKEVDRSRSSVNIDRNTGSLFVSTHKGQDSLYWVSPLLDFSLTDNIMSAHKVNYVPIADARIYPDQGEMTIEPMAKIRKLKKAKIDADTLNNYHHLINANIDIETRHKYYGNGDYTYTQNNGEVEYIAFDPIKVDTAGQTIGEGRIKSIDDFTLSPAFKYQGKVNMQSQNPLLDYTGATAIVHKCDIPKTWVNFHAEIDPKDVFVPIDSQPMSINNAFLTSGAMMGMDSVYLYPSFLSPRRWYSNRHITHTQGYLHYNRYGDFYEIGSRERITYNDSLGNYMRLNKKACTITTDGSIDLVANLGRVKAVAKGKTTYDIAFDQYTMDILMTLDFYLPQECFKVIADTILADKNRKNISLISSVYTKGVRELMGSGRAQKMFTEQNIFGKLNQIPEEMNKAMVLSEMRMVWNKKTRSWQSVGEIGLVNLGGYQINRRVKFIIEIDRKRSADALNIYMELNPDLWYFFSYKRGLMQAYSCDQKFNSVITSIKGSARRLPAIRGQMAYSFFLSNKKKKDDFLKRIDLNIEAPEGDGDLDDEIFVDEDGNVIKANDSISNFDESELLRLDSIRMDSIRIDSLMKIEAPADAPIDAAPSQDEKGKKKKK